MHCSTVSHTVVCDPSVRCDTRVKDYFKDTTLTNTQFEETIARWRVRKSASLSHFMVTSADTNGTLCWPSQHVAALLRFDEEINFEEDTKRLRNTSAFRSFWLKCECEADTTTFRNHLLTRSGQPATVKKSGAAVRVSAPCQRGDLHLPLCVCDDLSYALVHSSQPASLSYLHFIFMASTSIHVFSVLKI